MLKEFIVLFEKNKSSIRIVEKIDFQWFRIYIYYKIYFSFSDVLFERRTGIFVYLFLKKMNLKY